MVGTSRSIRPWKSAASSVGLLEGSLPDLLVGEALTWLDDHRETPFLLSVHFRAPHAPYVSVPEQDSALLGDLKPAIPDVPDLP